MVEIGVYGGSKFCLVSLIIEFEEFSLIIALTAPCSICIVIFRTFSIHHLDLVIEQSHGLYLVFQLKSLTLLVQLLGLCQIREEDVNDIRIVIEFQYSAIQLAFFSC